VSTPGFKERASRKEQTEVPNRVREPSPRFNVNVKGPERFEGHKGEQPHLTDFDPVREGPPFLLGMTKSNRKGFLNSFTRLEGEDTWVYERSNGILPGDWSPLYPYKVTYVRPNKKYKYPKISLQIKENGEWKDAKFASTIIESQYTSLARERFKAEDERVAAAKALEKEKENAWAKRQKQLKKSGDLWPGADH
jgi:hypothetical protein